MGLVVAARFETFATANSAAHALFADGFREEAVNIFYVNKGGSASFRRLPARSFDEELDPEWLAPRYSALASVALLGTLGAVAGASVVLAFAASTLALLGASALGAFLGSWVGAVWVTGRGREDIDAGRFQPPNVLLTVQADSGEEELIGALLRDAGGFDVERAPGRWSHGSWIDAEPRARVPSRKHAASHAEMVMH